MTGVYETYLRIATHPLTWMFAGLVLVFYLVQGLTRPDAEGQILSAAKIRTFKRSLGMEGWPTPVVVFLVLTWIWIAITLTFGLYRMIIEMIWHLAPQTEKALWDWRFSMAQLAALTTVLGAVIALPLTINRLILTRRQTQTAEQGHITDRINKAVELLGDDEPAVRMGAILSLGRVMSDSPTDRPMVQAMLNAYIIHHQPADTDEPKHQIRDTQIDVQAALDVLLKWTTRG